MDGIREMMRQVFTGGNLSAAEYAQAGRPSVQDVMQEAWVATDLPPETAETQELHMDKTEALQQMIRDELAPALEAAAQLPGVFHDVETVSPMMSRSPGDVDEGPFANGAAPRGLQALTGAAVCLAAGMRWCEPAPPGDPLAVGDAGNCVADLPRDCSVGPFRPIESRSPILMRRKRNRSDQGSGD